MSDDSDCGFRINEDYARKYDSWRQKELLQKLKSKYGDVDSDSSESSSETEDEDAQALSSKLEKDWLRTLSALKSKDPKIYQKDFTFYESTSTDDNEEKEEKKRKKTKPMYLKDYERNILLEKKGIVDEDSDNSDEEDTKSKKTIGYYEDQELIRKSFKVNQSDSEDSSSDIDLLTKRTKTEQEEEKEEEDYLKWLKGQAKVEDDKVGIELESLKDYWNNPSLEDGEKFLKDYILNKRFIEDDKDRIPTYEEIVDDGAGFQEEEKLIEKEEQFEHKYNFRFEEPDPDFIKSYPRQIEDTVRRKETKRATKRQEVQQRKQMEKEKKKEEIRQLKNLKKNEILGKIDKLKEISGHKSLGLTENDLEEDFDPNKHDQLMQKLFDEEYYGVEEGEQKPVFPEEEFIDNEPNNWDNWQGQDDAENCTGDEEREPNADDPNFVMDADYDPNAEIEVRSRKKKKRRSKFESVLMTKKPLFEPSEKSFEEYLDEYYKLDCEDIIGDIPCRFKYRNVTGNDFGLSVEEILSCKEKELNAWVSVKKMSQFRTHEEELLDVSKYREMAKNMKKKERILISLTEKKEDQPSTSKTHTENKQTANKKKKKRKKFNSDKSKLENPSHNLSDSLGKSPIKKTKRVDLFSMDTVEEKKDSFSEKDTYSVSVKKNLKELGEVKGERKNSNIHGEHEGKEGKKGKKKKRKLKDDKFEKNPQQMNFDKMDNIDSVKTDSNEHSKKNRKKQVSEYNYQIKKLSDKSDSASHVGGKISNKGKEGKKKKRKMAQMSDARLKAYGINPREFKYLKLDNFKGQT